MKNLFDGIARSALFTLDPETAHGLSITALKSGLVPGCRGDSDPRLAVKVSGLDFPNPLGMAAGYDKNAEVPSELARLGFGFVEVGTLTPKAQPGNPKPRIFRLVKDHAVINRLGFNNQGHAAAHTRVSGRRRDDILGINIGANKDTEDRIGDYVAGISRFADVADYFTVNISSPNTPGLRNLQTREALSDLLTRVLAERDAKAKRIPVFLKIAPDLTEPDLDDIAAECLSHKLDGVIISNTTLSRTGLAKDPKTAESGGLSGRPVFARSTIVLAKMRQKLGAEMPLIGVGGIDSADKAAQKIRAGADLIQLYTGFIYGGPLLPGRIVHGLSEIRDRENLARISELRDSKTAHYAALAIPE
jgi:dihydroorotate dehydrogenase